MGTQLRVAGGGAIILALVVATAGHFRIDDSYSCDECLSGRSESQWRVGLQPLGYPIYGHGKAFTYASIPLAPRARNLFPNAATARLFPPSHRHTWRFRQSSPYYLFGRRWGGCALGARQRYSPFAYAYLHNSQFPGFVEELSRSNQLSRTEAMALFVCVPCKAPDRSDQRYVHALRLVHHFSARYPNTMFEEMFNAAFVAGDP